MALAIGPVPVATPSAELLLHATAIFQAYKESGPHPDYKRFEKQFQTVGHLDLAAQQPNAWDFIKDAVEGGGGFCDGTYLIPHYREFSRATATFDKKYIDRLQNARYDNFVRLICDAPWGFVTRHSDSIVREDGDEQRLSEFWDDADGNGLSIMDALEFPARQARMYGTGWLMVDRAALELRTKADERTADLPYVYPIPTRNVTSWSFDRNGRLTSLIVLEPRPGQKAEESDVRVWTPDAWVLFSFVSAGNYFAIGGVNPLGEIPAVPIFDDRPSPGSLLGPTVMPQIARIGRSVFNIDSEIREIERKTAFPVLAVPLKSIADASSLTISTEGLMPFDGDSGQPAWLEPNLQSHVRLSESRKAEKESAFQMAEMSALYAFKGDTVTTSSGVHAEVEFDKTNRRIARFARSLESAEHRIAALVLRFLGSTGIEFSVTYPRDFGLRDLDQVVARTEKRLNLNLGADDAEQVLRDYYLALYPRLAKEKIDDLVTAGVEAKQAATVASAAPAQPNLRVAALLKAVTPASQQAA